MLIKCDQCGAKFKLTVKKVPEKDVIFKCGKCGQSIKLTPDLISARLKAEAAKTTEKSGTVKVACKHCHQSFTKPVTDKSQICHQCRIDLLVNRVKEKYGLEPETVEPEPKDHRYTLRSADGLVLGPIKLETVIELAREKRIRGVEEVAKDGGPYRRLMSYPELVPLFPEIKELMDTTGLEDKVDQAFMAAFGAVDEEPEPKTPTPPPAPAATPEPPLPTEPAAPTEAAPIEPEPAPPEPEPAPMEATPAEPLAEEGPVVEGVAEPIAEPTPPEPEAPPPGPEPAPMEATPAEPLAEEGPVVEGVAELAPPPEPAPTEPPEPPAAAKAVIGDPTAADYGLAPKAEGGDLEEVIDWAAGGESEEAPAEASASAPAEDLRVETATRPGLEKVSAPTLEEVEVEEVAPPPETPKPAASRLEEVELIDLDAPPPAAAPAAEPPASPAPPAGKIEVAPEEVGTEFDLEADEEAPVEATEDEEILEDLEPIYEPPPNARYRIRYPDGLILGPIKRGTIKELLETGNLTGQEDVQREEEPWAPFVDLPELAELLEPAGAGDDGVIELTDVVDDPG